MDVTPPVQLVLSKLNERGCNPRPTPRGHEARCPAHDDRMPSLGILQGDNGCAILSCAAGCTVEAIAKSLGLTMPDLFVKGTAPAKSSSPPRKPKKVHPTIQDAARAAAWAISQRLQIPATAITEGGTWEYQNADGKVVAAVIRHNLGDTAGEAKGKKQFTPLHTEGGGWVLGDPKGLWPLYHRPEITGAKRVWFTEGEKAADALRSVGIVVTTTAHGAKSPQMTDLSPLSHAEEIILTPDNDNAGAIYVKTLADLIHKSHPLAVVKIVQLPDLPEKGDAYEYIHARADMPDQAILDELDALAAAAPILPLPGEAKPEKPLELDHQHPLQIARAFLAAKCTRPDGTITLLRYEESWYRWELGQYHELKPEPLKADVYRFLDNCVRTDGTEFRPNKRAIDNVLDALMGIVSTHLPMPCWLDGGAGRPDPRELISFRSTILHVPTRKVLPPSPKLFTLAAVPFDYNPAAPSPTLWLKFLAEIFPTDDESIALLQEWFGYCLIPDTSQQKILLILGPSRSGKGTIGRVLKALIGDRNYAGPSLSSLARPFGLSSLAEKAVACFSDARFGGHSADENTIVERLLSISGEDPLEIDRKYKGSVTMKLPTRLIVLSNEMPRLADASAAIAKRFMTLETRQSFYGREDTQLEARLRAELPAILNWALDGLANLRKRGKFAEPRSSIEAKQELEDLSSPMACFVRDRCVLGEGQECFVDDLYEAYKEWCTAEGRKPRIKNLFGRDLRSAIPTIDADRPRTNGGDRLRRYINIACPGKSGYNPNLPETPLVRMPVRIGSACENARQVNNGPHGPHTSYKKSIVIKEGEEEAPNTPQHTQSNKQRDFHADHADHYDQRESETEGGTI